MQQFWFSILLVLLLISIVGSVQKVLDAEENLRTHKKGIL
jgi:hypothetical protein